MSSIVDGQIRKVFPFCHVEESGCTVCELSRADKIRALFRGVSAGLGLSDASPFANSALDMTSCETGVEPALLERARKSGASIRMIKGLGNRWIIGFDRDRAPMRVYTLFSQRFRP